MLTECLAIRRGLGVPRETAAILSTLATLQLQQDDTAGARVYQEEAIAIFRELGDRVGEAIGLQNLGEIAVREADEINARSFFEQCLAIAQDIRHQELESECERSLGDLALGAGDLATARERFERSHKVCQDAEDKRGEAISLWRLGRSDLASGEFASARKRLAEALRALQAFEMNAEVLDCLEDFARYLQHEGRFEEAVSARAAASAVREALALPRSSRADAAWHADNATARAALGGAEFEAASSMGRKWSLEAAIEQVLAPNSTSAAIA